MVRHYHRIAPAIALTLALVAAAPASARFDLNPVVGTANSSSHQTTNVCSEACSGGGYQSAGRASALLPPPAIKHVAVPGSPTEPAVVHVVAAPSDGFDWGDAGIGAGGVVALMTLVAGGVLVTTNSRRRAARASA